MGAHGEDVAGFEGLAPALARAAAAAGKPACVNVMIERVAAPTY
jgi:thiamine pyrophosphate-dependent acetolactate synthase large subunit-like protein